MRKGLLVLGSLIAYSFLGSSVLLAVNEQDIIRQVKEASMKQIEANGATPTTKKKGSGGSPSYSFNDVGFGNSDENFTKLNNDANGSPVDMDSFDSPSANNVSNSSPNEEENADEDERKNKKPKKQNAEGQKEGGLNALLPKKKFVYKIPVDAYRIPLKADNSIKILADRVVVVTFPFLISNIQSGAFHPKDKDRKLDTRIKIEVKDNKLFVSSKIGGDIDLLLQGGDYPVMLHLDIYNFNDKDKEVRYRYFAFEKSKEEISEEKKPTYRLTTETHEENIIQLNKAMYYDLKLKGFKVTKNTEKYDVPEVGISLTREKTISGMGYIGEKWIVKNIGDGRVKLTEEAFFREGTYSIWLENTYLDKNKTSRMFIIRKM